MTPLPSRVMPVFVLAVVLASAAGCARPAPQGGTAQSPSAPTSAPSAVPSSGATAPSAPSGKASSSASKPSQAPLAPEQNPPGDIPDNQVFVAYRPAGAAFSLKIPEGWSRTTAASSASFTDKLNTVTTIWSHASSAPTAATVRSVDVKALAGSQAAFQLVGVKQVKLPAGSAVLLTYRMNGEPNPVTGKRYRLEVQRYILFKNGTRLDLVLSSPVGADNVDPWRTTSESVRWQ